MSAQSFGSPPLRPQLTDRNNAQRFRSAQEPVTRSNGPVTELPSGAGGTGFESTSAIGKKKKAKFKPGDPKPAPPPPPRPPGPPQQIGGHTSAPQAAVRKTYAEAYKPPDAAPRRPPVVEKDAFEPLGIRAGAFLLRPSIGFTRGHDTNPSHQPNGVSSFFTTVEPALQVQSQWSRHSFSADLRGSYIDYDQLPSSSRPQLEAKALTRLDVSRDTRIDIENRYFLATDYPGSPNLQAGIAKLPVYTMFGGTAGLTRRFNHLELSGKASVDRTVWQDSDLVDGTTSSNHDRDYNQYGAQFRASYELWPGVKPFVEIAGDTRQHELQFDRNGFQRDSRALTPKVGGTFEITRKLTGEASIGYQTRRYEDAALQDLRGVVADASLIWAATGLTTATLTASSRADELVVAGASGMLRRDVGVQVDHAFRRWLIGTVRLGYGFDDYIGLDRADTRMSLGTAITYKLNREIALKGEYRYDWLRSNTSNVDYNASVFLVGLKLQR